jgi:putative ABC transport system substrate-binding protein
MRRMFIAFLCVCAILMPFATQGQPASKVPRIGVLALADIPYANDAMRQGLRDLGYVEGRNIEIEYRSARGDAGRLSVLAAELVALKVDLIVAMGAGAARATKQTTNSIPIVMAPIGNPIEAGFVPSLSRPGGNITGVSVVSLDLAGKRIALAKELLPNAKRIAVLTNPQTSALAGIIDASREASRELGLDVQFVSVSTASDLNNAFEAVKQGHADAVVAIPSPIFNSERPKLRNLRFVIGFQRLAKRGNLRWPDSLWATVRASAMRLVVQLFISTRS